MRTRYLLVAAVVLLGTAAPLWAGPFTEVTAGHWAYGACKDLAALGVLSPDSADAFSGDLLLTRFEFGIAVLEPLAAVEEGLSALAPGADAQAQMGAAARALDLSPRLSDEGISAGFDELSRLGTEFADVLKSLNFDPDRIAGALRSLSDPDLAHAWRTHALSRLTRTPSLAPSARVVEEGIRVPLAHGTVAFSFSNPLEAPELLDDLARSAAARSAGTGRHAGTAEPALSDPQVSRLRTAYEYGLGSALTLSLAYEDIARRGQGRAEIDEASLTSVGIGYRLTPSTSVKLSYSLLEYSNYVFDTPLVRDRLAETEVSVEF
jgi:hypothetical protein